MTETEVFELILGIKKIRVDRVDWKDQSLHIYCLSLLVKTMDFSPKLLVYGLP